jgi:beta-lactamase regulating signal transducer with metallopeptidase domain
MVILLMGILTDLRLIAPPRKGPDWIDYRLLILHIAIVLIIGFSVLLVMLYIRYRKSAQLKAGPEESEDV